MESSQLVAALERVWASIQRRHADVPPVVVTLGAGSLGQRAGELTLGHFAARRWATRDVDAAAADPNGLAATLNGGMAELFVGGEGLVQGAESVLETLLHEAAHGVADVRRIKDTSRQGRYHNARYKVLGEELGLVITQHPQIGWSLTDLAPGTSEEYADELEELAAALVAYRYAEGQVPALPGDPGVEDGAAGDAGGGEAGAGGRRPKNGLVLVCGCPKPRKIRASAAVVELGPILCGVCGQEFAATS
ncbi:hypothetical protein ACFWQC_27050 [Nocardioides sp. NPDC058538]|uniref:hypothetical protein n=1 Tax=Nocardioides sp. NPDC058538 TaxID=3346542 RepID=UPI00364D8F9D